MAAPRCRSAAGVCLLVLLVINVGEALPTLREQAAIRTGWIEYREHEHLPGLLKENGVRHWVLSQREYHEDTVWRSVASPLQINARRRTVIAYSLNETSEYGITKKEFVSFEPELWSQLREFLAPAGKIALNIDPTFAFSDGLSAGELEVLSEGLGPQVMDRVVRVPMLALDFIALRAPAQLQFYQELMMIVHEVITTAMSSAVISPGETTCSDVQWWLRERTAKEGLSPGFHPSFSVQRQGTGDGVMLDGDTVIMPGDLLWTDFGFIGAGLWTDTQHMGYVLREEDGGEVPRGLLEGLRLSNLAQDSVSANLLPGRTGNEVLAGVVDDMESKGIDSLIYCHPIGDHMHGAGATIGLADKLNQPIPVKGEVAVRANTWYSIELAVTHAVPEWGGQRVSFRQEEDAAIDGKGRTSWVFTRQSSFHLVRP